MNPFEPRNIRLEMTGGGAFYDRGVLAPVVEALAASELFGPETWGLGESASRPFDAARAASVADGEESFQMLQLKRRRRVRHSTLIRLSDKPGLVTELPPDTPDDDWRHLFGLGDALAEAYRPDIAWVHLFSKVEPPASDEEDATQLLLDACVVGSGVGYDHNGPGGLALRTYVGPRLVALAGRELLLGSPARVEELSWGGVRLDLAAAPWEAGRAELLAAWRAATEHLRPAKVFSEVELDERGYPRVTRGERFKPRAYRP
jgi:hypothetical protein